MSVFSVSAVYPYRSWLEPYSYTLIQNNNTYSKINSSQQGMTQTLKQKTLSKAIKIVMNGMLGNVSKPGSIWEGLHCWV